MDNKILALDIETARPAPDDPKESYALGVTCAATVTNDGDVRLWHGEARHDGRYASQMNPGEVQELALYLSEMHADGYAVATINGLGFDFRVLSEECGDWMTWMNLRELALDHVDPPFQMLCERGFMIGLSALAAGFGLEGKYESMDGLQAIERWPKSLKDQRRILAYVEHDAATTLAICQAIIESGEIRWVNRRGLLSRHRPTGGELLTVREALALPLPDTSWMDDPWPREKFSAWTGVVELMGTTD